MTSEELLTKEERMKLLEIKEDYLHVFATKPEMRLDNPELWHQIVDQYEAITERLQYDQMQKIMKTTTLKLDDDGELLIKTKNGVEHPSGQWGKAR